MVVVLVELVVGSGVDVAKVVGVVVAIQMSSKNHCVKIIKFMLHFIITLLYQLVTQKYNL